MLQRPPLSSSPPGSKGEAQLALVVLQLAETLADDNTTRRGAMEALAGPIARLFAGTDPYDFTSAWCAGELASLLESVLVSWSVHGI